MTRLTGQDLISYVDNNRSLSRIELCQGAGYYPSFTDFYEAILDARKANEVEQAIDTLVNADWYDSLTEQDMELYDMIEDMCPEFTKLDAEQCQEFMDELSEHGITTAEQFESAYYFQTDGYYAEREFAEYVTTELNCLDIPDYVCNHIDWQSIWDHELRHDFFNIEFDGETYFFNSNF